MVISIDRPKCLSQNRTEWLSLINTSTQKDQRPRRVSYNNCRPLPAASASRLMLPHPIKVEGAGLTYTYRGDTTVRGRLTYSGR